MQKVKNNSLELPTVWSMQNKATNYWDRNIQEKHCKRDGALYQGAPLSPGMRACEIESWFSETLPICENLQCTYIRHHHWDQSGQHLLPKGPGMAPALYLYFTLDIRHLISNTIIGKQLLFIICIKYTCRKHWGTKHNNSRDRNSTSKTSKNERLNSSQKKKWVNVS